MEPFIVGVDITDVTNLYGRERQISALISCAKRRENAGIIGARRFGKTCLLKSLENKLKLSNEFDAYPIYFDVKTQTGIKKDTPAVYRSLAALLASKMCSDGLLHEGDFKISRRCSLDVSDDKLDMLIQMKNWNPEYQKEVLFFLANKAAEAGKYVLLLLDEIDYLLLEALESPSDFSSIRGAATDKRCYLKFWVAGTSTWSSICTNIGSPELNCGLDNVSLPPLSKEEFKELWGHECSLFRDIEKRDSFLSLEDTIFTNTGGIPYYAKFVASHMINKGSFEVPDYQIIRDYLTEIINNRFTTDVERSALFLLADGEKEFGDTMPDGVSGLDSKGLIKKEGNTYSIGIGYLLEYLKARKQDASITNVKEIEINELDSLVEQISRLMRNVNINFKDKKPFIASTEDHGEFQNLKIVCHDEATIDAFSGSLYKLYYEGSNKGKNLPTKYKFSDFSNMVKALRHMYNHRECEPTSMTIDKLLGLVSHGRMPYKAEDYLYIQKSMLEAFQKELLDMLQVKNISKADAPQAGTTKTGNAKEDTAQTGATKTGTTKVGTTKIDTAITKVLGNRKTTGVFKKGKPGKKDYVLQREKGYKLEVRSVRTNEFLSDGVDVEFELCCEPNSNNPSKTYWFANDVHIKK